MDKMDKNLEKINKIDEELHELNSGRCMLPMLAFVELRRRQLFRQRARIAKDYYLEYAKKNPSNLWLIDDIEKTAPNFNISKSTKCTNAVRELCKLYGEKCNIDGIQKIEKLGYCSKYSYTEVDSLGQPTSCVTTIMATPLGQIRLLTDDKTTSEIAKRAQLNRDNDDSLSL